MNRPPHELCLPVEYQRCCDDGTIVVSLAGSTRIWNIRLIDCWCPEMHEPGGREAKQYAEKILKQCSNLAVYIPAPHDIHNLLANITFDRVPGHLFVNDTRTLSEMMVAGGHGTVTKQRKKAAR